MALYVNPAIFALSSYENLDASLSYDNSESVNTKQVTSDRFAECFAAG